MGLFLMRTLAALLVLALLAAGCGGGDDDDDDDDDVSTQTTTETATATPQGTASATATPAPPATPVGPPTAVPGQPIGFASSDGALVVIALSDEVPVGGTVTIEAYQDGAQWPQELIGAFAIGRVYELGPPGLALAGPLTITLRLDADFLLGDTEGFGANVYLFMLSDGEWRALPDLQSEASPSDLVLTAPTSRLGVLAAVFGDTPAAVVELLNSRRAASGG